MRPRSRYNVFLQEHARVMFVGPMQVRSDDDDVGSILCRAQLLWVRDFGTGAGGLDLKVFTVPSVRSPLRACTAFIKPAANYTRHPTTTTAANYAVLC